MRRDLVTFATRMIVAEHAGGEPLHHMLPSLAGHAMADRYCAWRGVSGRRYIASIHPVDVDACDAGLPAFEAFVLIAVARRKGVRRFLFACAVDRAVDARRAVARGRAEHAGEWHVHLLAACASARQAALADLVACDVTGGRGAGTCAGSDPTGQPLRLVS